MQTTAESTASGGTTRRTVLDQLEELDEAPDGFVSETVRADVAAQIGGPPLPPETAHIAGWWRELAMTRGSTGFGLASLTYPDLVAWAALTCRTPTPFEVEAILAGDRAFVGEAGRSDTSGSGTYDAADARAVVLKEMQAYGLHVT